MKENNQLLTYERAECHLVLLSESDVISCSGSFDSSNENFDKDGWT